MRDTHRCVVISPREVNALGMCLTVVITTGGEFARKAGMLVNITGATRGHSRLRNSGCHRCPGCRDHRPRLRAQAPCPSHPLTMAPALPSRRTSR
nr:type II toxin-antitoxin system PemK/MazF family toxin [uncultured Gellertiella sp.]